MRGCSPNKCKLTIGYKKLLENSAGKKMKNREWKLDSKKPTEVGFKQKNKTTFFRRFRYLTYPDPLLTFFALIRPVLNGFDAVHRCLRTK